MAAQVHASVAAEADGECERQTLPSPSHAGPSDAWGVVQPPTPRPSLGDIAAAVPKPSKDQRVMTSTQTVTPSPSTRTTPVREKQQQQQQQQEEEEETCREEHDALSALPIAPSDPERIEMRPSRNRTAAAVGNYYGPCAGIKDCIVVGGGELPSSPQACDEDDCDVALEHYPEPDDVVMSHAPEDDIDYDSDAVDTRAPSRSPRPFTPITSIGDTSSRATSQAAVQVSKQSTPPPPPPPPGGALEVTTQLSNLPPPQTRSEAPASDRTQSRKRQRSPEDQLQQPRPPPFHRRSPGKGSRDSAIDLAMAQTPSVSPERVLRGPSITPGSELAQEMKRSASPSQLTGILAVPDALGMQQTQSGSSAYYYQPQQPVEHQQPRHHFPPPPTHLVLLAQQPPRTLPPTQQPLPPQQRLPPHQPPPAQNNSPCCYSSPHQEQLELQGHHGSHDPYALATYYASAATGISREVHPYDDHPHLQPQQQPYLQTQHQDQPEQQQDRPAFRRLPRNLGPAHRPRPIPRYRARTPPPVAPPGNAVRLPSFAELIRGIPMTSPPSSPHARPCP